MAKIGKRKKNYQPAHHHATGKITDTNTEENYSRAATYLTEQKIEQIIKKALLEFSKHYWDV